MPDLRIARPVGFDGSWPEPEPDAAIRPTVRLPLDASPALELDVPVLTVVIPTFNERENIGVLYNRIADVLEPYRFEVIVVDDDSPDGTSAVVEDLARRDPRISVIRRIGQRGLAGACIEGMLAARSPLVAVMDADLQHEPRTLKPMLERMLTNTCDVVVASRYLDAKDVEAFSPIRSALSKTGNKLVRGLLHVRTSDPMSGFFMVRRSVVMGCASRLNRDGFKILSDLLAASGKDLSVSDIPYTFGNRLSGDSKLDEKVLFDFVVLVVTKAMFGLAPARFISFALIGSLGVVVHLSILSLLLYVVSASFLVAQTVATLVAMTANFFFNNLLTYRDQRLTGLNAVRGLALFWMACSCGACVNIVAASQIYGWTNTWLLATVAGVVVGAVCNYVLSAAAVWPRFNWQTRKSPHPQPAGRPQLETTLP